MQIIRFNKVEIYDMMWYENKLIHEKMLLFYIDNKNCLKPKGFEYQTTTMFRIKNLHFPRRELIPGLPGESQLS